MSDPTKLLSDLLVALDASQRTIQIGYHEDGSAEQISGIMVMTPELRAVWEAAHKYIIGHERMPMNQAEQTLTDLEQRVKDQIAAEYPDQEDRDYHYDNLTVPELLNMLSYMFS